MWTILTDESNLTAYNYIHYGPENSKFAQVTINQPAPGVLNYDRLKHLNESELTVEPRDLHIVYTDYATHLVGEVCRTVEGNRHEFDTVIWTREKQPSMYIRNKLRNYLLEKGHNIEGMTKSKLVDCWGEDKQ